MLRRGAVDGVASAIAGLMGMHRGDARASVLKKRSAGLGTVVQGAVDGCMGNGGARRHGVVLRRRRGGVGVGLKLIWKISTRALLYTNEVHHYRFY